MLCAPSVPTRDKEHWPVLARGLHLASPVVNNNQEQVSPQQAHPTLLVAKATRVLCPPLPFPRRSALCLPHRTLKPCLWRRRKEMGKQKREPPPNSQRNRRLTSRSFSGACLRSRTASMPVALRCSCQGTMDSGYFGKASLPNLRSSLVGPGEPGLGDRLQLRVPSSQSSFRCPQRVHR